MARHETIASVESSMARVLANPIAAFDVSPLDDNHNVDKLLVRPIDTTEADTSAAPMSTNTVMLVEPVPGKFELLKLLMLGLETREEKVKQFEMVPKFLVIDNFNGKNGPAPRETLQPNEDADLQVEDSHPESNTRFL